VFDTAAFYAYMVVVAQLSLISWIQFLAKEGGDVVWFDRMDGTGYQFLIDGFEGFLFLEHNVCGILTLHDAPVIYLTKAFVDRAIGLCKGIQLSVQQLNLQRVTDLLCLLPIPYFHKGIVCHLEVNLLFAEFIAQPSMTIEKYL
jgi:hypothetical protein